MYVHIYTYKHIHICIHILQVPARVENTKEDTGREAELFGHCSFLFSRFNYAITLLVQAFLWTSLFLLGKYLGIELLSYRVGVCRVL